MKTKKTLTAIFVAVLLAIGATSAVLISLDDSPKKEQQSQQQKQDKQEENDNLVRFTAEADKNVLEQLKTHADVVTKDSQYGAYVDSINGKTGGESGKYWTFYVDGEMAQIGAEAYITKGGETIEWKFE